MSVFGVTLVRIRENTDQNNSEYGHFSRSATVDIFLEMFSIPQQSYAEHMRMAIAKMNVLSANILEIIFNNPIKAYVTIT